MNFRVKTAIVVFTLLFTTFGITKAQTPTTCFEIESILANACGTPENGNEMVRFKVGPSPLDANNMIVNWPNNSWLGLIQNSTTATTTANLNATVTSCGILIEPPSLILPAGVNVLLITSQHVNITANSFANLSDTLYVIYQNLPTPTQNGHFSNSASTPRTLEIDFTNPSGCSDDVTYLGTSLIGGDGATVDFDWNGNPTYVNYGCTAPIQQHSVNINETGISICPGDTIDLSATIIGNFSSTTWTGGAGSFSASSSNTTDYFSSSSDNSNFYIFFEGITTCNDTLKDTVLVQIGANTSNVNITASTTELCAGDSILLTANGSGNYTWSTTSNAPSIYANAAGIYYVTSNTGCGSNSDTITITNAATISVNLTTSNSTICQGQTATLNASGANNYTWFNNTSGTSTTVNTSGNYYVIGYNNCYQDSQSIAITVIQPPTLNVNSSTFSICGGDSAIITASGSNNYLWNTSDTSAIITVFTSGTYTVTTSNSCFSASDSVVILGGNYPNAQIIGDTNFCGNITLTASGGNSYLWSTGNTSTTENFTNSGQVFVIATNGCGSDTAYHNIINHGVDASFITDYIPSSETPITVNFTNTSTGSNSFFWDFGDGNTSSQVNPSNTYTEQGSYTVTLTANSQFCPDVFEYVINIEALNTIFIPNVFTPNGDGMNDLFKVLGANIESIDANIFNRWGENIYSWNDINNGWNGTYQNKTATDGTYFYIIKVLWLDGSEEQITGSVTKLN